MIIANLAPRTHNLHCFGRIQVAVQFSYNLLDHGTGAPAKLLSKHMHTADDWKQAIMYLEGSKHYGFAKGWTHLR